VTCTLASPEERLDAAGLQLEGLVAVVDDSVELVLLEVAQGHVQVQRQADGLDLARLSRRQRLLPAPRAPTRQTPNVHTRTTAHAPPHAHTTAHAYPLFWRIIANLPLPSSPRPFTWSHACTQQTKL